MNQFATNNLSNWQDSKSWESFFSQFNEYLRNMAFSYKLPPQDVDDVVQEVFISMANSFKEGKFDPNKGHISSWVTKFAKWRMIDAVRRIQRTNRQVTSGDDALLENQADNRQDGDSNHESNRQNKLFVQAVKNLFKSHKNKDLIIFSDFYFRKMTNKQIMHKYAVNSGAIYLAKHRTIKRIKEEVGHILLSQPEF
jgi:RNA polymerase sigma factor (sigma-70 family)